jgi:RNA polymerase sigma-70 factor (ECF subfamily)
MGNDLLCKLKEGNEQAYKFIFNEYYALLTAFAYKYLHDLDTSKEIVQNVFVKFYEKRNKIEITISLKSYLYQMVYHDCISFIRSRNYLELHKDKLSEYQKNSFDYQVFIEQSEEEYKLYKLIEQLPSQCKKIFKLNRFDNKKNGEIAKNLNISVRTVETQLSKALKFLKANYKPMLFAALHL